MDQLALDCQEFIRTKALSADLKARIERLKLQNEDLSNHEAIEILLDYVERESRK